MEPIPDQPPPRWLDAVVAIAVTAVVVTAGYAAWCRTPLIWDGAYQFAETLRAGSPYVYLTRFHTLILWQPLAWLMRVTDDVRLLQAVYGLPFLLAPAVGLACCWWFVRRRMPTLIVWAAIGILATPLPGQIFVINDSVFQQHLFWPVLFGLLVPLSRRQKIAWAALAIFQFSHQIGLVLLAFATATTVAVAWRRRGWWLSPAFILALTLTLLMAAKVGWTSIPGTPFYDSYAAREASTQAAIDRWWKSVWGEPFNGLRWVWVAGGMICLQAWLFTRPGREKSARLLGSMAILVLLVAALHWTHWSRTPIAWGGAIEYRRWLVPLTMPIFLLAAIEAIWRTKRAAQAAPKPAHQTAPESETEPPTEPRPSPSGPTLPLRAVTILLLASVYAIVLGRQSTQVNQMTDRLQSDIAASASATIVLPPGHWLRESPLDHWSLGWHSLVLQGRQPTKWVAPTDLPPANLMALDQASPELPVSKFTNLRPKPGPTGWFDLSQVIQRAAEERSAQHP